MTVHSAQPTDKPVHRVSMMGWDVFWLKYREPGSGNV